MGFSISYKSMKNLAGNSFPRNLSAAFKALKTKFPLSQLRQNAIDEIIHHIAESVRGQYVANPEFRLTTRAD